MAHRSARKSAAGANRWIPESADLETLRTAAQACRGCELYKDTTQAVLGEGALDARVVLVGEQPGDQEDRAGRPFVGPAGRILDKALDEVGIKRDEAFVTNAVKHFRFRREARGKRRIHQPPDVSHIKACRPWFDAELALTDPDVIVALGATAGRMLLGPSYRVTKQRGDRLELDDGTPVVGTVHPSSILRTEDRESAYAAFVADLDVVASMLER
jgi:uracil-DNA glycosylase family protein